MISVTNGIMGPVWGYPVKRLPQWTSSYVLQCLFSPCSRSGKQTLGEWWACSTAVGWNDGCRAVGLQWRVGWEGVPSIRDLGGVLEVLCPKEWP